MFALAGGSEPSKGLSDDWILALPAAWLVDFHTSELQWNFHPQEPTVFTVRQEPCKGILH